MRADKEPRRKLAAIPAADVAGYSRLMGEDEAATVAGDGALYPALIPGAAA